MAEIELLESNGVRSRTLRWTRSRAPEPIVGKSHGSGVKQMLVDAFLPADYPHSVASDYLQYRVFDALQSLASQIGNGLAAHAALTAAGVGDANASAIGALVSWLVRDGIAALARISFGVWQSRSINVEPKRWRLLADALNDVAMCVDLLLPVFGAAAPVLMSVTGIMRAIVGVAGGATGRARLS